MKITQFARGVAKGRVTTFITRQAGRVSCYFKSRSSAHYVGHAMTGLGKTAKKQRNKD